MNLIVVTVRQSILVNLNSLHIQMNKKNLPRFPIVKTIKLSKDFRKQITDIAGIRRKLLIGKAG